MYEFKFNHKDKVPIFKQIANSVIRDIERGVVDKDFQLPSINEVSDQYSIARDTIERAYKELKKQGYITSVAAKGYYVTGKKDVRIKVLLVFNKLSSFKRIIYDNFVATLGKKAKVDLQVHHYNPKFLNEIIESAKGNYHYYVIMPHFSRKANKAEVAGIFKKIPLNELFLLDKNLPKLGVKHMSVYQDFQNDIYDTLNAAMDLLNKYESLKIVFEQGSNHPLEIIEGAKLFCLEKNKKFSVVLDVDNEELIPGTVYIVTAESDLAQIIRKIKSSKYQSGKEIGIISYNETALKEILDITVITTDFEAMGKTAANLVLKKEFRQVKNPF